MVFFDQDCSGNTFFLHLQVKLCATKNHMPRHGMHEKKNLHNFRLDTADSIICGKFYKCQNCKYSWSLMRKRNLANIVQLGDSECSWWSGNNRAKIKNIHWHASWTPEEKTCFLSHNIAEWKRSHFTSVFTVCLLNISTIMLTFCEDL